MSVQMPSRAQAIVLARAWVQWIDMDDVSEREPDRSAEACRKRGWLQVVPDHPNNGNEIKIYQPSRKGLRALAAFLARAGADA